jgi:hypothetical protein
MIVAAHFGIGGDHVASHTLQRRSPLSEISFFVDVIFSLSFPQYGQTFEGFLKKRGNL